MTSPHVKNARGSAITALNGSIGGGGLKGWAIRRVVAWFRRQLKKSEDLDEISRLCDVLISILTYIKAASWIHSKYTEPIDIALKALMELRSATVGN